MLIGFILRLPIFNKQEEEYLYDDRQNFEVPEEGFNEQHIINDQAYPNDYDNPKEHLNGEHMALKPNPQI